MTGRHCWTPPQELFLEIEFDNKQILVDPANVNSRVKEEAWEQVTQDVSKTFGLTYASKYNEIKIKNTAKDTKDEEKGKIGDRRLVAASMGQFKKYGEVQVGTSYVSFFSRCPRCLLYHLELGASRYWIDSTV